MLRFKYEIFETFMLDETLSRASEIFHGCRSSCAPQLRDVSFIMAALQGHMACHPMMGI